jgi:hypothetical protein
LISATKFFTPVESKKMGNQFKGIAVSLTLPEPVGVNSP